jgi:chromosome segregation ATPase
MTGGRASLIWLVLVGVAVALFAGAWLVPHLNRVSEQTEALNRLETEGQQLAQRVEDLTRELNDLLSASGQEEVPQPPGLEAAQALARAEQAKRLAEVRLLGETQDRLQEATLTADELSARIAQLETSITRIEEEKKLLAESEADLKDQLARSNRVVEAMRSELKGNSDRLIKLELRDRQLREQNAEFEDKLNRAGKLTRDLEDLYRRRDDLLTNIVRRYREIADEYRTVVLSGSGPDQSRSAERTDLSRIQHALSLADEDLQQFETLSSRAERIRKELSR